MQQDDLFYGTLKVKEHLLFQVCIFLNIFEKHYENKIKFIEHLKAMLRMDKKASKEDRLKRIEEVLLDVLKSYFIILCLFKIKNAII